ncbi:hypothetical protein [Streptomyces albogriseolus]|uniref:hypothetical protein n=1 Tax=Streptomyces albogriseolus TaxID=1887 RepID=UPI0036C20A3C
MNRKRTTEKRDQEEKIRFTPTAVRLIDAEARRHHQKFAGFVGDAALAVALGKAGMVGSPEDDPVRPLVEAIEAHTKALNRIGTNMDGPDLHVGNLDAVDGNRSRTSRPLLTGNGAAGGCSGTGVTGGDACGLPGRPVALSGHLSASARTCLPRLKCRTLI